MKPFLILVLAIASIVLLGMFLLHGYTNQQSPESKNSIDDQIVQTKPTALTSTATVPGFSNDRFNRPFQRDLDRLDPNKDGWDSEAISDLAMQQLNRFGHLLEADASPTRDQLDEIAVPHIVCDALKPTQRHQVFQDTTITVERSANAGTNHQGTAGFLESIETFRSAFGGQNVHAHFKIVRVEKLDERIQTDAYFQFGGHRDDVRFQINARWKCHWELLDESNQMKLSSLGITNYERVTTNGKFQKEKALTDDTHLVLGGNASYQEQMTRGLDHWGSTIDRRMGIDIVGIHGIAVGDIDGDGLDDIYLCEPGGLSNRLYLHKSDGTARDVSAVCGVDFLESTRSALFVDLDNDGDQDLVVGSDRFVIFLHNDGFGRYGQRAAFRTSAAIVSMAAADYDLDGDLDLYVCGYFTKEDAADGAIGLGNPIPFHDANNGAPNSFFQNDGNWRFSDVTKQVGLDQDNLRFSLAAAWQDYDNDGDFDLYVANDYGRNCLYKNENGHFENVAAEAGVEDISAGMSVCWGDYNRDGLWDIYVSNMFSSAGNRISYHRQFKKGEEPSTIHSYQRFAHGNTLFENSGDGTFRDVTDAAGVTLGRWAWGSNFVDINNDGWEDLFVTNGMLTREDSGDL